MTRTLLALALGLLVALPVQAQTVVATTNYDDLNEIPAVYSPDLGTFTSSSDVWDVVSSLTNVTTLSGDFLGARDIENGDNPNGDFVTATYGPVDVSGIGAGTFSFAYDVVGYDAGDDVFYTLTVDGVAQPQVQVIDGQNNGGTTDAGTATASFDASAASVTLELQIFQNGGSDYAGFDDIVVAESPPATSVTTSAAIGWRLLSAPTTLSVADLADINLVSGAGGFVNGTNCAVNNITNLFTGYTGDETAPNGGYVAPGVGANVEPGAGFFWYFFSDNSPVGPCDDGAGDVSTSVALPLTLNADGTGSFGGPSVTISDANDADGSYMLGNPFSVAMDISGISAFGASTLDTIELQSDVQAWDPDIQDYVVISADAGGDISDADADDVSIWQGFFVERSGDDPGEDVIFDYTGSALSGVEGDGFIGRREVSSPMVSFRVTNGALTGAAAVVRFEETAVDGWDRFDLSKLAPFSDSFAQIGPVGQDRDGNLVVKAVESLPGGTVSIPTEYATPLSFVTTEAAGEFTLTWPTAVLPEGWTASLRDVVTGQTVDLATETALTFTHDASAPAERFELLTAPLFVAGEEGASDAEISVLAPNPTAGVARMTLSLTQGQAVSVDVYDALGRRVATVMNDVVAAGAARVVAVPTSGFAPGVYVVRVTGETFAETRRLTVTR